MRLLSHQAAGGELAQTQRKGLELQGCVVLQCDTPSFVPEVTHGLCEPVEPQKEELCPCCHLCLWRATVAPAVQGMVQGMLPDSAQGQDEEQWP